MKKLLWATVAFASSLISLFILVSSIAPEGSQSQNVTPLSAVDVTITVDPSTVDAQAEATYRINYSVSDSPAVTATLVFSLPKAVVNWNGTLYTYTASFEFASPGYARDGDRVIWPLDTLPPGTVDQELVIVSFPAGPLDGSTFHASATFGDADGAHATADAPPVTIHTTSLIGVSKDPWSACVEQEFNYAISVRNYGTSDLFDVILEDRLPSELDFVTATMPFVQSGPVLTWTMPHLPTPGSRRFYVTVRAGMATAGTTIYNTATVSSAQGASANTVRDTRLYRPEIGVEKWWPTYVRSGDTFTYCVRFIEPHGCSLSHATLTETLPAGLTLITATMPYTRAGSQIVWSPAMDRKLYRLTVQADSGLANGTRLTNVVHATAPGAIPGVFTATAEVTDTLHLEADKWVSWWWSNHSDFYIGLSNPGTSPLTNLDVVDRVPTSTVFADVGFWVDWCNPADVVARVHTSSSATPPPFDGPGWMPDPGPSADVHWVWWRIPSLANQSVTLFFQVRHSALTTDTAENVATYTSDQLTGTVSATYRIPEPFELSSRATPDRASPEQDLQFDISYRNTSGITATNVSITSTLPPTATFVRADNGDQYLSDTHQVVWQLGSLAHDQSGTMRVTVRVPRGTLDRSQVCHQATLGSAEFPTVGPVQACVTVIGTRSFQLLKDTLHHFYRPGDTVTYRLAYVNTGDVAVSPLNVIDRLPDQMAFVTATTPNGETLWFSNAPASDGQPPPLDDQFWYTTPSTDPTWLRWERTTPVLVDVRYPLELVLENSPSSKAGTWITNTAIIAGEDLPSAQVHHRIAIGNMKVYLPLISKAPSIDLAIRSLTIDPPSLLVNQPATINLVIENRGDTATSSPFWVDLYIDPDPALMPPKVNQTWDMAGSQYGLTWLVEQPVAPGQPLTLTSRSYNAQFSDWPGSFNCFGTHTLYAQVDSFNGTSPFAAVQESNESNNTIGPVPVPVSCPPNATASCVPLSAREHAREPGTIPTRPPPGQP
jgi:uncharacterized repeat protein (TIGR01451 family)